MKKELKRIIQRNTQRLNDSHKDLVDIYNITFCHESANLVMAEDNDGYRIHTYTYGQIKQKIEAAADGIFATVGETHGYVGLDMKNSVNWIAAFWGILKSGNKPFLINDHHPDHMTASLLNALNITTVICDKAGNLDVNYIPFGQWEATVPCTATFENELAIATSATSLNETLCFYNGQNIAAQILNTGDILKNSKRIARHYQGALKQLAFLPFYHIFGLFAVYFWFTFYNRTLVFLKDLNPDTIMGTCRLHKVTHIFAVPVLWHTIEQQVWSTARKQGQEEKLKKGLALCTKLQTLFPYAGAALSQKILHSVNDRLFGDSVQFCISGGSAIRPSALYLMNGLGYPLHNGYGMSEIGIAAVDLSVRPNARNQGHIGKVFASLDHRLNDQNVLQIKGSSVCFQRMINREVFTTEDWFSTGDIMTRHKDDSLSILGRMGDVVIGQSGENINPDTIEPAFDSCRRFAYTVLGLNGDRGEELSLIVQLPAFITPTQQNELYEQLQQANATLSPTMRVARFYATHDPLMAPTAIKISRAWVKRAIQNGQLTLSDLPVTDEACSEEHTDSPLLTTVIEIAARVLMREKEELNPDAHLMNDLGVSSLQYFALLSALADEFSLSADQDDQYVYTLRGFCAYIERRMVE